LVVFARLLLTNFRKTVTAIVMKRSKRTDNGSGIMSLKFEQIPAKIANDKNKTRIA